MLAVAGFSLLCASALAQAPALQAYGADPTQTSVSGLSSGAYMAVQLQVAYSKDIIGSGVIAGGPYYCAANNIAYTEICMGWVPLTMKRVPFIWLNPTLLADFAKESANADRIDPISHLKAARIYIFSGKSDEVVNHWAVDATASFFKQVGTRPGNLRYENRYPSGHAIISPNQGNRCADNSSPYISHCPDMDKKGKPYDQAGELLKHIYEAPGQPRLNPPGTASPDRIVAFDQQPYTEGQASMADTGYLYVPKSCSEAGAQCKVHVALHGCVQSEQSLQESQRPERFHRDAGYNRWAEANQMLVLYPQVNKSAANPYGCWDWWGYSGSHYADKSAPQMKAIMRMTQRLAQPRPEQQ